MPATLRCSVVLTSATEWVQLRWCSQTRCFFFKKSRTYANTFLHVAGAKTPYFTNQPPHDQTVMQHLQATRCSLCWWVVLQGMLCCDLGASEEPTLPASANPPCSGQPHVPADYKQVAIHTCVKGASQVTRPLLPLRVRSSCTMGCITANDVK